MASAAAAKQPDLPVDLMEEILLHLNDVADLIRASAACTSFHRLISDGRFIRRFKSLHCPPVLGLLAGTYGRDEEIYFYPAKPPHRSAPAARAFARAVDFSVTSLPEDPTHYWCVRDVRDGRVLLSRRFARATILFVFEHLMVYDPLHRRQVQIPPIPHDLLAAAGHGDDRCCQEFDPFLVPAATSDEDDLSFQVMCNALSEHKVETFLYSSVTMEWRRVASSSIASFKSMEIPCLVKRSYACGCFYWVDYCEAVMLMLDMRKMKFSIVNLPTRSKPGGRVIVEVMENRVGLLILSEYTLDLYSKSLPDISISAKDWRHDHTTRLFDNYQWSFTGGVVEGYALLYGVLRDEYRVWVESDRKKEKPNAHCFTVELETLLIEELCVFKLDVRPDFLYARFPPPFATPSI
ncbi:unnamed protein product [Urochloa decumbens]|uniref:F-box domain-containing protein n=1 Tax=Urochloa decumbens TaxID=240449 RepID=A0ABC8VWE8_9POAL